MVEKYHKEFIVNGLYGLMDGNYISLGNYLREGFKRFFDFEPDELIVSNTYSDVISPGEGEPSVWVGDMVVKLTIGDDTFTVSRDFGEEYENDTKHPEYETDMWFYESEKCHSHKTYVRIKEELGIDGCLSQHIKDRDDKILNSVIGKTKPEAAMICKEMGYSTRIVEEDGESYILTQDLRSDRVNIIVEYGKIIDSKIY